MKVHKIERKTAQQRIRVAAYCRVSTNKAEQGDSFETQLKTYERMIRSNSQWEYAGIYADEKSGTSDKREGFQRMIADAQCGKIQYILVKSISRFSRNLVDCRDYIEQLQKCGVTVYFERENLESTAPGTSMMLSLMAAIAQDESRSNSENHRWAIQRRFERGEYKLGNNQILGYDADENGKPVPNGDAWIVQRIFQLFADESTVWEIAEILEQEGAHCLRSEKSLPVKQINYILRNEVYVGDRKLQKKNPKNYLTKKPDANIEKRSYYLKDIHEGIVDRTLWERVQAQLGKAEAARMEERDAGILRKRRSGHFLTGMLFCEKCGTVYCRRTFQKKGKDGEKISYHAWKCKERMKKGVNPCGRSASPRCSSPIVREEELLQEIANQLTAKGIAIPAQSRDAGMAEIVKRYVRKILIGESGITVKIPEERVA